MVEQRQGRRPGKVLGGVRPTSEDHRPTTFELFFDLVYVFAATQVTGYMAHEHSGHGVAQGLLLLALMWWTWSAYAWLGNQARVDEGVLRVGMAVAMAAIFVVALTIPEAWHDAPGGLDGPLVLVGAYLLVRCVHFVLYTVAATGDRELRHQLAISSAPLPASAALLVPGALLGGWIQTLLFAGALLVDWGGVYLTRPGGQLAAAQRSILDRATRAVHHPGPRRIGGRHRGGRRPEGHQRAAAAGGRPGRGRRRRPVVAVLRRGVAGGRPGGGPLTHPCSWRRACPGCSPPGMPATDP